MTTAPVACWILNLEESANEIEYLVIIWPGGKVEFEESPGLEALLDPKIKLSIDARALYAQGCLVDRRDVAEVVCDFTRQVKLDRNLTKQVVRANRRGYFRDHSRLPYNDPRRTRLDLLATVIDKALEKIYWEEWAAFMTVRPERRSDKTVPQTKRPLRNSEINYPSNAADSQKRF